MYNKNHHDSTVLQDFMKLPSGVVFPLWPTGREVMPLTMLPPVNSEYSLQINPEDWTGTVVVGEFDAQLYIAFQGIWWKFPKICENAPLTISSWSESPYPDNCHEALYSALSGIIELGKRDLTNPKYDSYFAQAVIALQHYESKFNK